MDYSLGQELGTVCTNFLKIVSKTFFKGKQLYTFDEDETVMNVAHVLVEFPVYVSDSDIWTDTWVTSFLSDLLCVLV